MFEKSRNPLSCGSGSRSGGTRTHGLLVPNQARYQTALHLGVAGADNGTRTHDLLITNQPLYQLSYIGRTSATIIANLFGFVHTFFILALCLLCANVAQTCSHRCSEFATALNKNACLCYATSNEGWPHDKNSEGVVNREGCCGFCFHIPVRIGTPVNTPAGTWGMTWGGEGCAFHRLRKQVSGNKLLFEKGGYFS